MPDPGPATVEIDAEDRRLIERAAASAPGEPTDQLGLHRHLLEYVPVFRNLCRAARVAVEGQGFAVLRGIGTDDAVLLALTGIVGRAVTTGNGDPGVLIYDVTPAPTPRFDLPVSQTRDAFPLHTDGTGLIDPPHHVLLACVDAAAEGGRSVLASAAELTATLRSCAGDDVIDTLREPAFVLPLADAAGRRHLLAVPVLGGPVGREHVRYRSRMASALRRQAGRSTGRHIAALDALERALATDVSTLRLSLGRNDALLIDNRRMLHGRTAIAPGAYRHLKRLKLYPVVRPPR